MKLHRQTGKVKLYAFQDPIIYLKIYNNVETVVCIIIVYLIVCFLLCSVEVCKIIHDEWWTFTLPWKQYFINMSSVMFYTYIGIY